MSNESRIAELRSKSIRTVAEDRELEVLNAGLPAERSSAREPSGWGAEQRTRNTDGPSVAERRFAELKAMTDRTAKEDRELVVLEEVLGTERSDRAALEKVRQEIQGKLDGLSDNQFKTFVNLLQQHGFEWVVDGYREYNETYGREALPVTRQVGMGTRPGQPGYEPPFGSPGHVLKPGETGYAARQGEGGYIAGGVEPGRVAREGDTGQRPRPAPGTVVGDSPVEEVERNINRTGHAEREPDRVR